MSQAKAREEALEGALKSVRGNLLASIDSSQKLLGDMALVSAHLNRHGWEVKHDLSPGGEAPLEPSSGIDDGGAGKLAKALLRLRLHFSYITEAVQNNVVSRTQASMAAPSPAKAPSAVLPLDIPTVKTFTRAENDSAAALLKVRPPTCHVTRPLLISNPPPQEIKGIMSRLLHAEEALGGIRGLFLTAPSWTLTLAPLSLSPYLHVFGLYGGHDSPGHLCPVWAYSVL